MTTEKTEAAEPKPTKAIGEMTVWELIAHINTEDEKHKKKMKHWRALLRAMQA